jgi:hypothetical protein
MVEHPYAGAVPLDDSLCNLLTYIVKCLKCHVKESILSILLAYRVERIARVDGTT